jgi:D-threonate/D-erythronate kinase
MSAMTVIADDLTGAAEIAGIAWTAGVAVQLVMDQEVPVNSGGVVVLNSDTRNYLNEDAAEKIDAMLKALPPDQTIMLFKKTDSLLRGAVLPEIQQILDSTHFEKVLLMPANPSRNRFVRNGRYFIGEQLINETVYKNDPEFPRSVAEVRALINDSEGKITTTPAVWNAQGPMILVPDTSSVDQMKEAIKQHLECDVLPAGGADFFKLLLEQWLGIVNREESQVPEMPEYVCCILGSFSASTGEDMKLLSDYGFMVVEMDTMKREGSLSVNAKLEIQTLFRSNKMIAFRSSAEFQEGEETRLELLEELTGIAAHIATQTTFPVHFMVTGGRTASLFCKKMLWNRLDIRHVVEEGIVTMQYPGSPHWITLKPGSYPWPVALLKITQKES